MISEPHITAVVVTYNRPQLLEQCLAALLAQSRMPDRILIADNASGQETQEVISRWKAQHPDRVFCLALAANMGGAGGFAAGVRQAAADGTDFIWLMDDDARPAENALELLASEIEGTEPEKRALGSVATGTDRSTLCWPLEAVNGAKRFFVRARMPRTLEVTGLPFLGLLIPASVVTSVGLPDEGFFISGDDFDYCQRLRKNGLSIIAVRESIIFHPVPERRVFQIAGLHFTFLILPPWKRYYETRNRVLIASARGRAPLLSVIPSSLARLLIALTIQKQKSLQALAILTGLKDGIRRYKGLHPRFRP